MGKYPLNNLLIDKFPTLINLQQPRKTRQAIRQRIPRRRQRQEPQFTQPALRDEDVGERWIADAALQFERGHFADGVFVAGEAGYEVGGVEGFHVVCCAEVYR